MNIFEYIPQSKYWPAFRVTLADGLALDRNGQVSNVRLFETVAGNMTEYSVMPSGAWHGVLIERFAGYVKQSDVSKADSRIALASSGSWSGGGNWRGWIFGKPGAVVWFGCKGHEKWLVFGENGANWNTIKPGKAPVEL